MAELLSTYRVEPRTFLPSPRPGYDGIENECVLTACGRTATFQFSFSSLPHCDTNACVPNRPASALVVHRSGTVTNVTPGQVLGHCFHCPSLLVIYPHYDRF